MPARLRTQVLSDTVQRLTIWDNFDRHRDELLAQGAVEADLVPLREAAKTVEAEEQRTAVDMAENPALREGGGGILDLTTPRECANGWVVAPPTRMARRWAATAVLKLTGGEEPDDSLAFAFCVVAGLWVLKAWGEGRRDMVMQTVLGSGKLAELIPQLVDKHAAQIEQLAGDYSELMGFKKKAEALAAYQTALDSLRLRCSSGSIKASSSATSAPGDPSGLPGPSTKPGSATSY